MARPPKKSLRFKLIVFVLALAALSWATSPTAAPPASTQLLAGAQVPPGVLAILQRSCADCHSENTHYPWYSYVAPASFLVVDDVTQGRRHLNLSRWNELPMARRQRALSEIANQVEDGGMPLYLYTVIHRNAKLSKADTEAVFNWTQTERDRLITESNSETVKH